MTTAELQRVAQAAEDLATVLEAEHHPLAKGARNLARELARLTVERRRTHED